MIFSGIKIMSNLYPKLTVNDVGDLDEKTKLLDVFVVAMGFEDRASEILKNASFSANAHCILIRYNNEVRGNKATYKSYLGYINGKFKAENQYVIDLSMDQIPGFVKSFESLISSFGSELSVFGIDVSGMTSYVICIALKYIRDARPFSKQLVFYTAAATYNPSRAEYDSLVARQGTEIDYLPKSMALEMSENLVLDCFSGHRSGDGRACLALFAGYEAHRSSGTIEATNPSLLLMLYGAPGDTSHQWRLDLSKRLHTRFEKGRRCATETVSTLHLQESLDALELYYGNLIDDHDLIIAPVCSKMHSVAALLFWERYGEVQLTFPLPIGYDPVHRPIGVSKTYFLELYERKAFSRTGNQTS
jgi:hypothetical protein